jgi:hypothetical protein
MYRMIMWKSELSAESSPESAAYRFYVRYATNIFMKETFRPAFVFSK